MKIVRIDDLKKISVISLFLLLTVLYSQDSESGMYKTVSGKITYISVENFYIDVGKSNGVSIGDLVRVYRENSKIGEAEVTNISSKSAVCRIITGDGFQLDDRIEILVLNTTREELPAVTSKIVPVETTPTKLPKITGNITSKLLYESNGENQTYSQQRTSYSFSTQSVGRFPISITGFGNLYISSSGEKTISPNLNQMEIQYDKNAGNWEFSIGRFMNMTSNGSSAADGVKVTTNTENLFFSVAAGIWDTPSGKRDFKNSITVRWKKAPLRLSYLMMSIISQRNDKYMDEYLSFQTTLLRQNKWRGSFGGLFQFYDGTNFGFDHRRINAGLSWQYSSAITTMISYNASVGTGTLGGYSSDQVLNDETSALTSSIKYEFNPLLRMTFSTSLRKLLNTGKGHSFSLLLEKERVTNYLVDLSVFSDFYTSKFYRSYLIKSAISKRFGGWHLRSGFQVVNQSFRVNNENLYTSILTFDSTRRFRSNVFLGSRIELASSHGTVESYVSIDYSWRF
ncbi:MAG: hypothetical protein ACE5D7_04690 [Fidelibacterota bacterium]